MLSQTAAAKYQRAWARAKGPAAVKKVEVHRATMQALRKIQEYRALQNTRQRVLRRQNTIASMKEVVEKREEEIIALHREVVKLERAWEKKRRSLLGSSGAENQVSGPPRGVLSAGRSSHKGHYEPSESDGER